jgi:hypothetical protein
MPILICNIPGQVYHGRHSHDGPSRLLSLSCNKKNIIKNNNKKEVAPGGEIYMKQWKRGQQFMSGALRAKVDGSTIPERREVKMMGWKKNKARWRPYIHI